MENVNVPSHLFDFDSLKKIKETLEKEKGTTKCRYKAREEFVYTCVNEDLSFAVTTNGMAMKTLSIQELIHPHVHNASRTLNTKGGVSESLTLIRLALDYLDKIISKEQERLSKTSSDELFMSADEKEKSNRIPFYTSSKRLASLSMQEVRTGLQNIHNLQRLEASEKFWDFYIQNRKESLEKRMKALDPRKAKKAEKAEIQAELDKMEKLGL